MIIYTYLVGVRVKAYSFRLKWEGERKVDVLYGIAVQDVNNCGVAAPSSAILNLCLEEEYFCGMYLLRLMVLDLVLLGHCCRLRMDTVLGENFILQFLRCPSCLEEICRIVRNVMHIMMIMIGRTVSVRM